MLHKENYFKIIPVLYHFLRYFGVKCAIKTDMEVILSWGGGGGCQEDDQLWPTWGYTLKTGELSFSLGLMFLPTYSAIGLSLQPTPTAASSLHLSTPGSV